MTPEELFSNSIGTIRGRANSWHRSNRIYPDYDDLISIGNEVFLNCVTEYNPKKANAKFNTFLFASLNSAYYYHCITLPNQKRRPPQKPALITDWMVEELYSPDPSPEQLLLFAEKLKTLSPNATFITDLVLNPPKEFLTHMISETGTARVSKKRIQRYLRDKEWPYNKIWNKFREIKEALAMDNYLQKGWFGIPGTPQHTKVHMVTSQNKTLCNSPLRPTMEFQFVAPGVISTDHLECQHCIRIVTTKLKADTQ